MRYKGLKGKAWEAVRRYVKRKERDCYTCGAKDLVGKNAQAGHYYPVAMIGSNNKLSWDPRFIHLQCGHCNGPGQGMQLAYRIHLIRQYGSQAIREFEQRRYKVDPIKNWQDVITLFDSL